MLTVFAASSQRAVAGDFAEGLAAFDAGDLRAAHDAWLPLAEAGDSQAQVALAGLLESGGPGLPRDLARALQWYRRAAHAGDAVAQMNLGAFFAQGTGVPRDRARALAWLSLSAEQGQPWAIERRAELLAVMAEAEREAARKLIGELRRAN